MQARLTYFCQWVLIAIPVLLFCGRVTTDIAMSVIAVLFLLHSAIGKDFSWLKEHWVQVALVLTAYMTVRALAADPLVWFNVGYSFTWLRFPVAAAAIAYWLLPTPWVRRYLLVSLTLSLVFIEADCLFQFFTGADVFGHAPFRFEDLNRLTGPFVSPRPGITLVWLIFPMLLGWIRVGEPLPRWLIPVMGLSYVAVFLTGERMAFLLLLTGSALCFMTIPRARLYFVLAVEALLLLAFLINQAHPEIRKRQVGATHSAVAGFSQTAYGQTARSAVLIFMDHPVFGSGVRSFQKECIKPEYGPTDDPQKLAVRCPMHTHNPYLSWLVEYGAVGLSLYLLMLACWTRDIWLTRRQWFAVPIVIGLIVTMMIRVWPITVTTNQFVNWYAVPFWLCVGWLYSYLAGYRVQRTTK